MNLLLVDDDAISIRILADFIKPHLNNVDEVICANDGSEAYDIVLASHPDIIVTDIKMPIMTGIELIKRIRLIDEYDPHIIIISGYSDFSYARDALKLNVLDYILKPVDQDELIDKINQITTQESSYKDDPSEDVVERVKMYISEHLEDHLTLSEIADGFHYNAAYLGRRLKEDTGYSFTDYLLKLRVIKAKSLLINTHDTVKLISQAVGFRDPEHFSKRFKKVTGMTPSYFRKENQE
jgi:YesN/AraC family two-component response regulator